MLVCQCIVQAYIIHGHGQVCTSYQVVKNSVVNSVLYVIINWPGLLISRVHWKS